MRKGILQSIAMLTLGAGTAWGQSGPPAPAAIGLSSSGSGISQAQFDFAPPPVVLPQIPGMPPGGPPIDMPLEGGAAAQPPVPMYPPPGPYGAPLFQSAPAQPSGEGTGTAPHYWSSFEYLLYFPKAQSVPFPLLTSSAPNDQGLIGRASTIALVPAGELPFNATSGFRTTVGFFGDEDRRYGAEAVGFALEQKSNIQNFVTAAGGTPTLARPFVNSTGFLSSALVVGNLFYGTGSADVISSTQTWGVEGSGVLNLFRTSPDSLLQFSLDFLAGYRFLQLNEEISITSLSMITSPPSTIPDYATSSTILVAPIITVGGTTTSIPGSIVVQDQFRVQNRFNGGQAGLRGYLRYGMFTFLATGKVAIGSMRQTVDITGITGVYDGLRGYTGGSIGGVLANASNIGRVTNDDYAVIPEFNVSVGVNLTRRCTASLGYNFLYINSVVRPGTLINPLVNTAQIPASATFGASNTAPVFNELFPQSSFFLHGLNFTLGWKF